MDSSSTEKVRDVVQKGVGFVRRRVFLNRLLANLFFDLLVALSVFGAYLIADRLLSFALDPLHVLGGLLGVSLVVSVARTLWRGRTSSLDAAVLIDDTLRLKERVSTTIFLRNRPQRDADTDVRSGQWAELVEADGVKRLAGVRLPTHFPLQLPRVARWVLVPLAVCVVVLLFVPQYDLLGFHSKREAEAALKNELQEQKLQTERELEELAKLDEEQIDPDLKEIVEAVRKELEKQKQKEGEGEPEMPDEKSADGAKKGAMVEMSRMEEFLKQRMSESKFDKLRELIERNQTGLRASDELTRRLQQAIKKGDFKEASEELAKLKQELDRLQRKKKAQGLTEEEKKRLEKLAEDLKQLAKNSQSMSQLSQSLGAMSAGMSGGDLQGALDNLKNVDMDLAELEKLAKQMEFLDQSMQAVKQAKQNMSKLGQCKSCGKAGMCNKAGQCGQCSGSNFGLSKSDSFSFNQSQSTGPKAGIGAGQGKQGTPEDTTFKREHLRDRDLDPTGSIVATLPFEGELPIGEAREAYKKIVEAAQKKAERVEKEAIPVEYRDQVRRYMSSLVSPLEDDKSAEGESSSGPSNSASEEK